MRELMFQAKWEWHEFGDSSNTERKTIREGLRRSTSPFLPTETKGKKKKKGKRWEGRRARGVRKVLGAGNQKGKKKEKKNMKKASPQTKRDQSEKSRRWIPPKDQKVCTSLKGQPIQIGSAPVGPADGGQSGGGGGVKTIGEGGQCVIKKVKKRPT